MDHLATLRLLDQTLVEVYRDDDTPHWDEVVAKLSRQDVRFVAFTTRGGNQLINVENVLAVWPAGDLER